MAALVVQSRFAGLKIEDDDYPSSNESKPKKKQQPAPAAAKKNEPPKKNNKNNTTNKNQSQPAPKKKKNKPQPSTDQQWEQWKQKDEELVDGNFESELQQAILLSKLDYEEKKDVYKQTKKQAEVEKKAPEQKSSKKKKKNVMSLEQFNDMVSSGDDPKVNHTEEETSNGAPTPPDRDTEFFERVKDDAKHELLKDKIFDRVRNRPTSDEVITRGQFAEALERKDQEIIALREEVDSLKKELHTVKSRNKKLCNILGQGEMKDKAEVLIEVERLRAVQDELNSELASLHQHLERERSKNQDCRTKDKKKKSIRFDVSSEALIAKDPSAGTT